MNTLYAYTRAYADETGAAMHLALSDGRDVQLLNHGFGILFPRCTFDSRSFDGLSRGLAQPWLFRWDEAHYGVVALPRGFSETGLAQPETNMEATCLLFRTGNLIDYEELGLRTVAPEGCHLEDIRCTAQESGFRLDLFYGGEWHSVLTKDFCAFAPAQMPWEIAPRAALGLGDALPACTMQVSDEEAARLRTRLLPLPMPEDAPSFPFPLMPERGDPMVLRYRDGYLFMATDDEHGQLALKIRFARTLAELLAAEDHVLLRATAQGDMSCCLWAPELHWVGSRLCIFFAAGVSAWHTVQSRIMMLEGSDPLDPACWSEPRRVVRMDGQPLTSDGITLDMTVIPAASGTYVIWSQRPIRYVPEFRSGTADLMIARLDEQQPWQLASEPVVLSRPEFGWERIASPVNEGPFLLRRGRMLYVTYAAAQIDHTYCVGMLTAPEDRDLTEPAHWRKCGYPVLHRLSVKEWLGAGHNAFVQDEQGRDIMTIHALPAVHYRYSPGDRRRYPAFRQVVWDEADFPHFDAQPPQPDKCHCLKNKRRVEPSIRWERPE